MTRQSLDVVMTLLSQAGRRHCTFPCKRPPSLLSSIFSRLSSLLSRLSSLLSPPTMSQRLPPNVHVSTHPCLQAKLSQLRASTANARESKALVHEIALMVGIEATAAGLSTAMGPPVRPCLSPPRKSHVDVTARAKHLSGMSILLRRSRRRRFLWCRF